MEFYDSLIRMIAALAVVLSLMVAVAWGARRLLGKPLMPGVAPAIRVLATAHLGGRKSIMLVTVADQTLILGTTATNLVCLGTVPPPHGGTPEASASFAKAVSPATIDVRVNR
ncbi:MAG: flagellar biosynthetic protein FliO [Nitrospiraceae bacterium]